MPGNIEFAAEVEELVDKIQGGREMTKDEMLAALVDDQAVAEAAGLTGDYANASPADARAHEKASEIAENAYHQVQADEFDDRFIKPEIPTPTRSRNDDMEMEM